MRNTSGRSKPRFIMLALMILVLIACNLPALPGIPTASTSSSASPANHIIVSITDPTDGGAYPIDAGLSIRAKAISDNPITHLELWADGELYEDFAAPEKGLGLLTHSWSWSPDSLGTHTLMVRAYNDQNQAAVSNILNLEGIDNPGFVLLTSAEEGDTAALLAQRYGLTLDEVLNENPVLTAETVLSAGDEVRIQIPSTTTSSIPTFGGKVLASVNQWAANGRSGFSSPPEAPLAPLLSVTGKGCDAVMSITDQADDEKGFQIYRLAPGGLSFSALAPLPAHKGGEPISFTDQGLYGLYHYYVSAYDDAGETASNLVSLKITDTNCAGTPTTIDSLASLPAGVEQYYLYLSIANKDWQRLPAQEFTYLNRSQNLDFNQIFPSLLPLQVGSTNIHGEVWGMVNGTANLLGTFEKKFDPKQPPSLQMPSDLNNLFATTLKVRGAVILDTHNYDWVTEKGMNYDVQTFRYEPMITAQAGIWQVSSAPFPPDPAFDPPCLLLTGKTKGSSPGSPAEFTIDFSPLKPTIELALSSFELLKIGQIYPNFVGAGSSTPGAITTDSLKIGQIYKSAPFLLGALNEGQQQTVGPLSLGGNSFVVGDKVIGNAAMFDPCTKNVSPEGVATYYVRLIPLNNGQPASKPSNTVIMQYDPQGQIQIKIPSVPGGTYYDVQITNFTGVHAPENGKEYCVRIVENLNLQNFYPYKPGDILCPKHFKGGSKGALEQLADAIVSAVNFIADLYQKLSDWVVDLAVMLNPLCSISSDIKSACHAIAEVAVAVAKTYVGLPPSIPNFDQLVELGKGNLVDLAAQELEANGVPCPQQCKDVIKKGIDYTVDELKKSMSNSSCKGETEMHEIGLEPLCLPEGVTTEPDPRGQPAPAVAEVLITRRKDSTGPNFPEPASCFVSIDVTAVNDSHINETWGMEAKYDWNGVKIEGGLLGGGGPFAALAPGESTKLPIILTPSQYWLPGHKEYATKARIQTGITTHFNDWGVLYEGAMATVKAGGSCKFDLPEVSGFSSTSVAGNSLQVGPLAKAWTQPCYPNCP